MESRSSKPKRKRVGKAEAQKRLERLGLTHGVPPAERKTDVELVAIVETTNAVFPPRSTPLLKLRGHLLEAYFYLWDVQDSRGERVLLGCGFKTGSGLCGRAQDAHDHAGGVENERITDENHKLNLAHA